MGVSRKEQFVDRLAELLNKYTAQFPESSRKEMPQAEFSAIEDEWKLSTGFLKTFSGKADTTIQTYKYRKNLSISGPVATKIRQFDFTLSAMQNQ